MSVQAALPMGMVKRGSVSPSKSSSQTILPPRSLQLVKNARCFARVTERFGARALTLLDNWRPTWIWCWSAKSSLKDSILPHDQLVRLVMSTLLTVRLRRPYEPRQEASRPARVC